LGHYLVTGGAGFIGLALARSLATGSHRVVLLDRKKNLERVVLGDNLTAFVADISDPSSYPSLSKFGKFDAVLHLAAQTSARISHEEPDLDFETNVRGTLLLLDWCRQAGVSRFLYASSMAVYGNPEKLPVSEELPPAPASFYGVSKLAGEHYIRVFEQFGIHSTIFRLFNVYGPGQDMENLKQGMASVYLAYVLKGEEVPVTGGLDRFRDFIFIDDVVSAWRAVLDSEKSSGRVYNLGSGSKTTVRELLDVIIRECGHDPARYPVRQVDGHAGDLFGMLSDSSRFRNEFGWRANVSLSEGIAKMVAWCQSHEKLRT